MGFFRKKKADPANEPESTATETPAPAPSTTETASPDAAGCPERGEHRPSVPCPTIEDQDAVPGKAVGIS